MAPQVTAWEGEGGAQVPYIRLGPIFATPRPPVGGGGGGEEEEEEGKEEEVWNFASVLSWLIFCEYCKR